MGYSLSFGAMESSQQLWMRLGTTQTLSASIVVFVAILCTSSFLTRQKIVAISITSPYATLQRWIRPWRYLLDGPDMVHRGFCQSHGEPFEIYAPDKRMVFVSSAKHIKELDNAPDTMLSLSGAAKHLLQPYYTMNGFNWFDRRGVEGTGFVRTLRTLLTNNVPQLLPDLNTLTISRWSELLVECETTGDGIIAPVYPMMMNLVVLLNARSLFGEDLIKDKNFMSSALSFVEETLLNAEIVKLMPSFLRPVVGDFLSRRWDSHKMFFESLIPATEKRIEEQQRKKLGHSVPAHADCIQWIIETAPKQNPWSAKRVIYELMAIWFGSVHILSTTIVYVIHDLCLHPEYIQALRQEIETSYGEFEKTGKGLPFLDSFIKESVRLTPVESMSVRRCALQPFHFSDGTRVNTGDWVCAPSGAINRSAEYYPSPDQFSGFRFVDPAHLAIYDSNSYSNLPRQPKCSKMTDVEHSWLMWGSGRMTCPGRYYASTFMKVIIAQLLMRYDFSLVDPDAPRWISWRVARIPRSDTKLIFASREQDSM